MADFVQICAGSGQHDLKCGGEIRKCFDECDDAFAFLDFYLGIFDTADLFFGKSIEAACETDVDLGKRLNLELLISFFEFAEFGFDGEDDANALTRVYSVLVHF